MAEDWPSPHHHELHPLPRVEDLPQRLGGLRPRAGSGRVRRVLPPHRAAGRDAADARVGRGLPGEASDLRAELRSLRAAGWAPYPRGYAMTPERSMLGSVPEAVPRIALEVIFLVVVAAVVAVAELSALEIIAVMAGAVLITFLVELIASRDAGPRRRSGRRAGRAHTRPSRRSSVQRRHESTEADELAADVGRRSVADRRAGARSPIESTEADEERRRRRQRLGRVRRAGRAEPVVLHGRARGGRGVDGGAAGSSRASEPAGAGGRRRAGAEPVAARARSRSRARARGARAGASRAGAWSPPPRVDEAETGIIARRRFLRRQAGRRRPRRSPSLSRTGAEARPGAPAARDRRRRGRAPALGARLRRHRRAPA